MATIMPMPTKEAGYFDSVVNIVRYGSHKVADLIAYRKTDRTYNDVVDNYVYDVWTKVLTKEDLQKAFDVGDVYLIQQAYFALGWYQGSQEVEEVNERGLTVKRMRPNSELLPKGFKPPIATFQFVRHFIENPFPQVDDFLDEQKLLNVKNALGVTPLMFSILNCVDTNVTISPEAVPKLDLAASGTTTPAPKPGSFAARFGKNSPKVLLAARIKQKVIDLFRDRVRRLIEKRVDLNIRDATGETALYHAVIKMSEANGRIRHGYASIVERLIRGGADLNLQFSGGQTLLHIVAANWEEDLVELLLKGRADVSIRENDRDTPFHVLLKSVNMVNSWDSYREMDDQIAKVARMVNLFLAHGAGLSVGDEYHTNVLQLAKNPDLLRPMLEYAKANDLLELMYHQDDNGFDAYTTLWDMVNGSVRLWENSDSGEHFFIINTDGVYDCMVMLLHYGYDPSRQGPNGKSVISIDVDEKQREFTIAHWPNRPVKTVEDALRLMDDPHLDSFLVFTQAFQLRDLVAIAEASDFPLPRTMDRDRLRFYLMGARDTRLRDARTKARIDSRAGARD